MSNTFLLISLIACIKLLLDAGMRRSLVIRLIHAAIYVGFVVWIHPLCLQISKLWVDSSLNTPQRLSDVALVVMADLLIALTTFFSLGAPWPNRARFRYDGWVASVSRLLGKGAYLLPSPLFLAALFYLRVETLFLLPGVSFIGSSAVLALSAALLVVFAPQICRFLDLGEELSPMLAAVVLIIVIVAGIWAPGAQIQNQVESHTMSMLLQAVWLLGGIFLIALVGYFLSRKRHL